MIKIRKLEEKDTEFMLEWMHDPETLNIFQNNFLLVDECAAKNFINSSFNETEQHFAIVDDAEDEYLGTISLKNIDHKNKNAEYAISTRKKARGKGINDIATKLVISYGFNQLKLHKVYLNVLSTNKKAIGFYKKCGFKYEGTFQDHLFINDKYCDLEWYSIVNHN